MSFARYAHSSNILLSLLCLLLFAPEMTLAVDDYANIELRKQKIDYLNDLLRIRETELKIEELSLQRKRLHEQKPQQLTTQDSSHIAPPPAPISKPVALSLESYAQLIEIRNHVAIIEIKGKRHTLSAGMHLRGWTLRKIQVDQAHFSKGQRSIVLHLGRD
ncbi:MAG: hypothetical protein ACYYK0_03715 [Candidatus Eutrophobiaceae bacterium]